MKQIFKKINEKPIFMPLVILMLLMFLSISTSKYSCYRTGNIMNKNTKYEIGSGCFVETKSGAWVKLSSVRYNINE